LTTSISNDRFEVWVLLLPDEETSNEAMEMTEEVKETQDVVVWDQLNSVVTVSQEVVVKKEFIRKDNTSMITKICNGVKDTKE